jgi:hypothetical protein
MSFGIEPNPEDRLGRFVNQEVIDDRQKLLWYGKM